MENYTNEEKNDLYWESLKKIKTGLSEFENIWKQSVTDIIPLTPFKVDSPNLNDLTGSLLEDINKIDEKYFQRGFQAVVLLSDIEYYFEKKRKNLWMCGFWADDGYYGHTVDGTFREAITQLLSEINAKIGGLYYSIVSN